MMACPDLRPGYVMELLLLFIILLTYDVLSFMKGWLLGAALLLAVDLVVAVVSSSTFTILEITD